VTLAAVLEAPQMPVVVKAVEEPDPAPGEVRIRMEACGICHSDLFVAGLARPPLVPLILGHEGIGRVEEIGAGVAGLAAGDRVGVTFLASTCKDCEWCRSGRERYCPRQRNSGYSVHGALAVYACVPAQYLVRVPGDLPAAAAAPLCCAGWTAYGAVREAQLAADQTLALFGMGGLGHLAVQYAHHRGLRVAAVDVSEEKLALARSLGAAITLPAGEAARRIQKQHGGADAAIVFAPSAAAIDEAFRSLKRTGTLVLVALVNDSFPLPIVDAVLKGITVRGSFLGTRQDLEDVFSLAQSGTVRAEAHAHALEAVPELLAKMKRGELLGRAVIEF
jgi:propanol-preferring alcohol dehydrogenase